MTNKEQEFPKTGYVRLPDILRVFPVGKSTWWAGVKASKYPPAHKLSPRCTAWKADDILALLERVADGGPQDRQGREGEIVKGAS